jgi:2-phospho-L-lactate guanylyltransferase
VHVLVPLKRLSDAKSRLADVLSPRDRAGLMRAMVGDVLDVAGRTGAVTLVSSDPAAPALAREHGADLFDDAGLEWNDALAAAMREVVTAPFAVVLSGDVPLVTSAGVTALVTSTPPRGITVARALDGGTNAIAMRPPAALYTCFGAPGSAARHAELARAAGLTAAIVDDPGLALDIDTADDLDAFLLRARPGRTLRLLERTHVNAGIL